MRSEFITFEADSIVLLYKSAYIHLMKIQIFHPKYLLKLTKSAPIAYRKVLTFPLILFK